MTTNMTRLTVACGLAAVAAVTLTAVPAAAQGKAIRIVQTNAAGDNVHLIDPATNEYR